MAKENNWNWTLKKYLQLFLHAYIILNYEIIHLNGKKIIYNIMKTTILLIYRLCLKTLSIDTHIHTYKKHKPNNICPNLWIYSMIINSGVKIPFFLLYLCVDTLRMNEKNFHVLVKWWHNTMTKVSLINHKRIKIYNKHETWLFN